MNAKARITSREAARTLLTAKIDRQRKLLDDKFLFTTVAPDFLIAHAEWCLRWIDCAPEGANHLIAPLQDKAGVPMGTARNENVGPCEALRNARAARGLHPITGEHLHPSSGGRIGCPRHWSAPTPACDDCFRLNREPLDADKLARGGYDG